MTEISHKSRILGICLALTAVTLLSFLQLRNCDFITYDDPTYVTDNYHVNSGLTEENIVWVFTTGLASNWHPVTWLSHMFDCQFFKTDPHRHHIINLLFHIANALLLFILLTQTTGAVWPSAFVAAAFALHPLHVQSVAWVSERKDVLSTLFWFLTMICYVRYVRQPSMPRYLLTLLVFLLGLMTKPMLVTLPFVLLLFDYWPLERFAFRRIIRDKMLPGRENTITVSPQPTFLRLTYEKLPFFIFSVASSIITFLVQKKGGAVVEANSLPFSIRAANCFVSYVKYIAKMFWPSKLAIFYPHPIRTIPGWQIVSAVFFLLAVSIFALVFSSKYKYLLVGWLWYLGTLVPVIGLVQVGEQALADRYTYVPLIGLFIIIAWGISDLLAGWQPRRIVLGSAAIVTLSALSVCTYFQVSCWQNSYTLFKHAVDVVENNYMAYHSLGSHFYQQGKIDQAIANEYKALQIKPVYPLAYAGLGMEFMQKGQIDLAVNYLTKSLQSGPNQVEVINNLAWILATYRGSKAYNPQQGLRLAQKACEISKYQDAAFLDTLAAAYAATNDFTQAVAAAEKALKLALASQDKQLADNIQQRLSLYKNGKHYIEALAK